MIDRILKMAGLQRIPKPVKVGNYTINVRPDLAYAEASKHLNRVLTQMQAGIR